MVQKSPTYVYRISHCLPTTCYRCLARDKSTAVLTTPNYHFTFLPKVGTASRKVKGKGRSSPNRWSSQTRATRIAYGPRKVPPYTGRPQTSSLPICPTTLMGPLRYGKWTNRASIIGCRFYLYEVKMFIASDIYPKDYRVLVLSIAIIHTLVKVLYT